MVQKTDQYPSKQGKPRRILIGGAILLLLLVVAIVLPRGPSPSSITESTPDLPETDTAVNGEAGSIRSNAPGEATVDGGLTRVETREPIPGGMSAAKWDGFPPETQRRIRSLVQYADTQLDKIGEPAAAPMQDLEAVHDILENFLLTVKNARGFPIGTNQEIVRGLLGNNPWGTPFLPADHPSLSSDDQLLDRWQTPLFFHALAADEMEIRSAGPDRSMWTEDDIVYPQPPPFDKSTR